MKKKVKRKVKKFYKKNKRLVNIFAALFSILLLAFIVRLYTLHLNRASSTLANKTDAEFVKEEYDSNSNGFYTVDIEKDMNKYFKSNLNESVTYRVKNETFKINIYKSHEKISKKVTYHIDKIADDERDINARVTFDNLKTIEFRTGGANSATVIHLIGESNTSYFVITGDTYYTLGDDIESISFENGDFYYRSYNNKYLAIDTVGSCNEELRLSIEDFNEDDVFYTYGKINFLKDFYQKLASKSYSVRDKCASLEQSKELQE